MESNPIVDKLPKHLKELVIDQPYDEYTPQDHALWRYVMRQNMFYLAKVAHHSYIDGLGKTGIHVDYIPKMYGMNRILKEIGWAAVAVDGFIPPAAFMEFQAHRVLVIAADIRPIDQIGYTPAPDIIHEAAGHAPIIADKDYAEYLVNFGKIGAKAFKSKKDLLLYEAIRHLSILKADPKTSTQAIEKAEQELNEIDKLDRPASELAMIRNLHWWTVEYGLIGSLEDPKIYGAGLLSSISESYSCLQSDVKKLPYDLSAARTPFDITKPQPQLFVTPSFEHLNDVLEAFSLNMAYKTGGIEGLKKAIDSENVASVELNTGVQISGIFTQYLEHKGEVSYVKTEGPTALSIENKQLTGQGKDYHQHGYSTIVGKIKDQGASEPSKQWMESKLNKDGTLHLIYENGIELKGQPRNYLIKEGRLILVSFENCRVWMENTVLFEPEWGVYDLAIGQSIPSVFPGPADAEAFQWHYPKIKEKTHKIKYSAKDLKLHEHYQTVRAMRVDCFVPGTIEELWNDIEKNYPEEWLIMLELLELLGGTKSALIFNQIMEHLNELKKDSRFKKLIDDGLTVNNL